MEINRNNTASDIQSDDAQNGSCSSRPTKQLAMVYSPIQNWHMLYSPEYGFRRGTIFEELDKPLEEVCNR